MKPENYMLLAIEEAKKATEHGDVPIGCIVVSESKVVAKQHNKVELLSDSTAHAEILAIREAQKAVGYKHLLSCQMYVTLEPCSMCAGAIVLSRLEKLHIAASDPKTGACGSLLNIVENSSLNHNCIVDFGLYEMESSELIRDFFKKIRERNGRRN